MKKLNLQITRDQARILIQALDSARNDDYPESDPFNSKCKRLKEKLIRSLAKDCQAYENKEI